MEDETELLLRVDNVKYRKAGDGKSPIGRLAIFREYIEWRDNASPEVLIVKYIKIKGQLKKTEEKTLLVLQVNVSHHHISQKFSCS